MVATVLRPFHLIHRQCHGWWDLHLNSDRMLSTNLVFAMNCYDFVNDSNASRCRSSCSIDKRCSCTFRIRLKSAGNHFCRTASSQHYPWAVTAKQLDLHVSHRFSIHLRSPGRHHLRSERGIQLNQWYYRKIPWSLVSADSLCLSTDLEWFRCVFSIW